jgi:hypothetical protein
MNGACNKTSKLEVKGVKNQGCRHAPRRAPHASGTGEGKSGLTICIGIPGIPPSMHPGEKPTTDRGSSRPTPSSLRQTDQCKLRSVPAQPLHARHTQ